MVFRLLIGVFMDCSEFLWMFPCYILATNYTRTPDGDPVFDAKIRFAAPTIATGRSHAIAIFTDADAAHDFIECTCHQGEPDLLEILDIVRLKRFLDVVAPDYRYLAVDLNAKNRASRIFLIEEVLRHIDQDLDHP
jgi:hypothetical protein